MRFNLFEWWRRRRRPTPPGSLTDLIHNLEVKDTPLTTKRPPTLRQYALSQLDKNERSNSDGKG